LCLEFQKKDKNYPITGAILRDDNTKPKPSTNSLGLKPVLCLHFLPPHQNLSRITACSGRDRKPCLHRPT